VFYAGWNYYRQDMHGQLMPMVYTSLRELRSRFPAFPGLERIQKAFQRMDEDSGIIASGKAALNRHFEIKRVNGDIRSILNLPGDRTVAVVFAHLCYDPSSTVGFLPFDYFEQWLTATYEEAVQNRGVVWVFKLHPHELAGRLHPRYNTRNHLERLAKRHPSDNIRVIETDVTTYDLLPVTDIGVTAVGDVSWELPAYGVNCITLTRALNSDFGFTIDLTTEADYRTALRNIQHFPPLSHTQQRRAQAYAGLLYADEQSIDAGNLFSETERDAERLDAGTLNAFVRCNLDTFTKIIGRRKI